MDAAEGGEGGQQQQQMHRYGFVDQRQFFSLPRQIMMQMGFLVEPFSVVELSYDWVAKHEGLSNSRKAADTYAFFLRKNDPLLLARDPVATECMRVIRECGDAINPVYIGLKAALPCMGLCSKQKPTGCAFYVCKNRPSAGSESVEHTVVVSPYCGSGACMLTAYERLKSNAGMAVKGFEGKTPLSTGRPVSRCAGCGKHCNKRCGGCASSFYCSKECQTRMWPKHKKHCNRLAEEAAEQQRCQKELEKDVQELLDAVP